MILLGEINYGKNGMYNKVLFILQAFATHWIVFINSSSIQYYNDIRANYTTSI